MDTRYFLILSLGHSGGLWLSRILNSHPATLCYHEGVLQRIFPRRYYDTTKDDILQFLESLWSPQCSHYRKAYQAVGDVGSLNTQLTRHPDVQCHFNVYGVIRNPVNYIRSLLTSLESNVDWNKGDHADRYRRLVEQAKEEFPQLEELVTCERDKLFVKCVMGWHRFSQAKLKEVFRLEDLSTDKDVLAKAMRTITGVQIEDATGWEQFAAETVNRHAESTSTPEQILSTWPSHWRKILNLVCGELASDLGYEV